ncbi:cutinase-domain-containing protein [Aspergillus sergii]|uniref:Cutinase n=1 Tax=Aspergillus sergii TaxID=1034303 RepID=A0A5N6XMQ8_9EURO|nr:cutinase-domain-containing protein [Aspergillus sergii]
MKAIAALALVGGAIAAPTKTVESRQLPGMGSLPGLENGVTQNAGCQELTFIFARGTSEMGNMGSVVGPPVANQLASLTGNKVTVQGVDYPADAAGNANMGASGGPKMAELIQQAKKQCPNTKVVLGGYSQGAMVVHNAASKVGADAISGAVLFGDPFKTQGVGQLASDKVKEFCASGDPVCLNGMNFMAHLSYGSNAQEAAQFLVQAAGL